MDANTSYNLEKLNSVNDLGVIFDSNLTFKDHMAKKNTAYSILGIIKRNFVYILNSTQRATMDVGVKHRSAHIYLFTTLGSA